MSEEKKRRKPTWGYYKNDKGETKSIETLSKVFVAGDGVVWQRIPRPKPPSRANRRDSAVEQLNCILTGLEDALSVLEEIQQLEEGSDSKKLRESLKDLVEGISSVEDAKSELESLKEELDTWKENLPENLQSSDKANQLEEASNQLDSAISSLDSVEEVSWDESDIQGMADTLEENSNYISSAIEDAEGAEFPGMY